MWSLAPARLEHLPEFSGACKVQLHSADNKWRALGGLSKQNC